MESPLKEQTRIDIKASQKTLVPSECAIEDDQRIPFFGTFSKNRENTWVISLFVLLHLVAFTVTMFVNDCWGNSHGYCAFRFLGRLSVQPLAENPLLGPSPSALDKLGALRQKFLGNDHQLWRIFTSLWLHAGAVHLTISLSCVIFIGIQLEQKFGPLRIAIIYLLSGLSGSLLAALTVQNTPQVCSSGALFGLIGAAVSGLVRNWKLYNDKCLALAALFLVSTFNLLLGLLPFIDNFSNLGGLLSGFLLGFVLLFSPQLRKEASHKGIFDYGIKSSVAFKQKLDRPILRSVCLVLFALLVAGLVLALIGCININEYCSWCKYIDCVPSRRWICDLETKSCQTTVSAQQMTLTCVDNDNFRTLPFASLSPERMEDLCSMLCS